MRSNRKHTLSELVNFINLYEGGHPYRELCEKYGLWLNYSNFNQYYLKFVEHGIAGLESSGVNNTYTEAFKENIVQEYLQTGSSIRGLARKYHIPNDCTVKNWIIKYTKGEKHKDDYPKPEVYIMKGQKKTQQEKLTLSTTI